MRLRRIGWLAVVCAFLVSAGCGGDDDPETDRFSDIPKRTIEAPDDKTAPRWQQIADVRDSKAASRRIVVSRSALQWRVRWRCRSRRIAITVTPPPASSNGRAGGSCPGRDSAIWVGAGRHTVAVRSSADFRVIVDEEVRTPLHERAPASVRAGQARELGRGRLRPIESKGRGTAILYRLPGGRLALRMEGFATEPNPDLDIWLSESVEPTTTRRIFRAGHTAVGSLKSTIGDQNYLLPATVDAYEIRSIVVVNAGQRIAYAAATLAR
ncbi:MAG: DM13 domain-containing protein [Solirubrobacteraceae bacterium]